MKTEFDITTTEKRGSWVSLAATKCNELGIDTRNAEKFVINNTRFSFSFDSDLMVTGLIRKSW